MKEYEFQLDKNRRRIEECPCGLSNKDRQFVPFIGHDEYGYCHACTKNFFPPPDPNQRREFKPQKRQEKQLVTAYRITRLNAQPIDRGIKLFTEVFPYKSTADGIICHLSLNELHERLNEAARTTLKDKAPAILKGIYEGGTSGNYSKQSAPFLFFDIDVKPGRLDKHPENPHLLYPVSNQTVFDYFQKLAVLTWRSNSQNGIAGLLHVPYMATLDSDDTQTHLHVAKVVYKNLTDGLKDSLGIGLNLDEQQGKFRQIRFLAGQHETRTINSDYVTFKVSKHEVTPITRIDPSELKSSLDYTDNFTAFLMATFGARRVSKVLSVFFIGTSYHWYGATMFWYIAKDMAIRSGKIMLYDTATGRRVKEPKDRVNYLHSVAPLFGYYQSACFFGEHQLNGNNKPVFVVESEKTAIIGSIYHPQFVWLACGGISGLKTNIFKVLEGRTVKLIPDANGVDSWSAIQTKLAAIYPKINFNTIVDIRKSGQGEGLPEMYDIADILLLSKPLKANIPPNTGTPAPPNANAPERPNTEEEPPQKTDKAPDIQKNTPQKPNTIREDFAELEKHGKLEELAIFLFSRPKPNENLQKTDIINRIVKFARTNETDALGAFDYMNENDMIRATSNPHLFMLAPSLKQLYGELFPLPRKRRENGEEARSPGQVE
jgi:hypothetical protein